MEIGLFGEDEDIVYEGPEAMLVRLLLCERQLGTDLFATGESGLAGVIIEVCSADLVVLCTGLNHCGLKYLSANSWDHYLSVAVTRSYL